MAYQFLRDPETQGDCDVIAAQLRNSDNWSERSRLVEIARRKGFLLPAHFASDMAIARREAGEVATFSAGSGDMSAPVDMSESRAELLASFSDGAALLAKYGLKANPKRLGDGTVGEGTLRGAADRNLSYTEQGRAILKRRGFTSTDIERMQRPS